ncbi:hypothetical protein [Clavibacter zhangzhiyongii]|uniref:hypothetical protein n=1 Tax=Clavibacter zhangzhiyongii TaxID=2768071 RepID=UPI0039DF7E86
MVVVVLLRGVGGAEREAGDGGDEADDRHDPGEDEVARVDVEAELAGDREPQRRDDARREQHEAHRGGGAAARGASAAGAAEGGDRPVGGRVGGLPVVASGRQAIALTPHPSARLISATTEVIITSVRVE